MAGGNCWYGLESSLVAGGNCWYGLESSLVAGGKSVWTGGWFADRRQQQTSCCGGGEGGGREGGGGLAMVTADIMLRRGVCWAACRASCSSLSPASAPPPAQSEPAPRNCSVKHTHTQHPQVSTTVHIHRSAQLFTPTGQHYCPHPQVSTTVHIHRSALLSTLITWTTPTGQHYCPH